MVTASINQEKLSGYVLMSLSGKSTDVKPTETFKGANIKNGSTFYEIDTGKVFMLDGDTHEWVEQ